MARFSAVFRIGIAVGASRFQRRNLFCFYSLALLLCVSCATHRPAPAQASPEPGEITALNVIAVPVGLNLDNIPGPDSFSVKVYATDSVHPKAIPIRKGTLEILTFDGTLYGRSNLPPVLRAWTFDARDLVSYQFKSHIGAGYEFTLSWGTNKPTHTLMAVASRYTSPEGQVVTSRSSAVTVIDK